jgi:competence ComEA-like helix-hairpin-helix protein
MSLEQYQFTRKEIRGILFFIVLCTFVYSGFYIFQNVENSEVNFQPVLATKLTLDSLAESEKETLFNDVNDKSNESISDNNKPKSLFKFDPNKISKDSLLALGINSKAAYNITKYVEKGGSFRTKEDLKKIYNLKEEEYDRIKEYISLPDTYEKPSQNSKTYEKKPMPIITRTLTFIDINTADSSAWTELKGIGPFYASQIIEYRNKLGGFQDTEQLLEVFGISDTLYLSILPDLVNNEGILNKININTCTFKELNNHPYIKFKITKNIMAYRDNHGSFKSVEDLKKIKTISDDLFIKIRPYLKIED